MFMGHPSISVKIDSNKARPHFGNARLDKEYFGIVNYFKNFT